MFSMVCFLLISVNVSAQQASGESNTQIIDVQNDANSIIGTYKTDRHKFYYEQYGTIQYATIEFKENNRAELRSITDNRNSNLKSKTDNCHVRHLVDYLEYKILEDGSIELTCVDKEEDFCGSTSARGCFEYVLPATVTESGIKIRNQHFIRLKG